MDAFIEALVNQHLLTFITYTNLFSVTKVFMNCWSLLMIKASIMEHVNMIIFLG